MAGCTTTHRIHDRFTGVLLSRPLACSGESPWSAGNRFLRLGIRHRTGIVLLCDIACCAETHSIQTVGHTGVTRSCHGRYRDGAGFEPV